jgi:hypothetical protein
LFSITAGSERSEEFTTTITVTPETGGVQLAREFREFSKSGSS